MDADDSFRHDARHGPGHVQWDPGGWFGALFGCTAWMLLAAFTAPGEPLVLGVGLGAFAVGAGLGVWLWTRRDRWRPHPALQLQLLVLGLLAGALFAVLQRAGQLDELARGWRVSPWLVLGVYPGLMAFFAWLERRARRARAA